VTERTVGAAFRLGDQLAKKFQNNVSELAEEYSQLLLFTGHTKTSAAQFVAAIEQEATDLKISKVKLISGELLDLRVSLCYVGKNLSPISVEKCLKVNNFHVRNLQRKAL